MTSADRLQSLPTGCQALTVQCFTQTGYRVYLPSPFNFVVSGPGRQEITIRNCFNQPVRVYRLDAGYTALMVQAASTKLVTEATDLVLSTLSSLGQREKKYYKKSRQEAPTGYRSYRPKVNSLHK